MRKVEVTLGFAVVLGNSYKGDERLLPVEPAMEQLFPSRRQAELAAKRLRRERNRCKSEEVDMFEFILVMPAMLLGGKVVLYIHR